MTIQQALLTIPEYAPDRTQECLDLLRHIELGDAALYLPKARHRIAEYLSYYPFPDDVRAKLSSLTVSDQSRMISIAEYAEMHGRDPATIRQRILRGTLPAQKIGRNWVIAVDTPLNDNKGKEER